MRYCELVFERGTERARQRDRIRQSYWPRHSETQRESERDRDRQSQRERDRQTEIGPTERKSERQRQRKTEPEIERQRQIERVRERMSLTCYIMLCYMVICKAPLTGGYSEALSAWQAGENKRPVLFRLEPWDDVVSVFLHDSKCWTHVMILQHRFVVI